MRARITNPKSCDFYRMCAICNFKVRASKTQPRWDNLIVCHKCYEIRHPQDFIGAIKDDMSVPNPRPRQDPKFVDY